MSNCENCSLEGKCESKGSCTIENNPRNKVKYIIGVMSGKGGVGKSTISSLIASQLNRMGCKVGILDADITGPSIPRFFGVTGEKVTGDELGAYPVETSEGIKVMSMNFLMDFEEQPVIWRGPLIGGAVKQFWTDIIWGELDYLIIDMPPGTGDVALTAMQSIPINGIVMVSVPQDLVSMIVAKAVNMTRQMKIKVLGVIENMSYIICPDCNKKISIFEGQDTEKYLKDLNTELLGELPMTRQLASVSKEGIKLNGDNVEKTIQQIVDRIIDLVKR